MNDKITGFDIPHTSKEDKLRRILDSALESKIGKVKPSISDFTYWGAEHFDLDKVDIFTNSTKEEQTKILELCNQNLLEEAYFIEKAGVGYMSKMVMLAETTEERMLYALFSADEVTHLARISSFLPNPELVSTNNSFLHLLADVAETSDKAVLVFVLQVILEGWGLTHYRNLSKNCQHPQLKAILQSFLEDESRHHATGVRLCEQVSLHESQQTIIEILASFLYMVQVGPQGVVAAVERVLGSLSRQQKISVFQQLGAEAQSSTRLKLLRSLITNSQTSAIVQELDARNCFTPFLPEHCLL
jgi:rubrerythrin